MSNCLSQINVCHFINGKCLDGSNFQERINPSDESISGKTPFATQEELDLALKSASNAFPSWKRMSRVKRSDLFFNLCKLIEKEQENLSYIISLETGKSLNEAKAEVLESLHMCQWVSAQGRESCGDWKASEIAQKDAYVIRKPKGVVAVISPWNFPLAIGSFWTTGPALLEGNTVVHKPSELTPFTAQYAATLYREAGFPDGVYNVIHGSGHVGAELVIAHEVRSILFTGSASVGQFIRQICAGRYTRNCSTETGSKSATIVFEDGDQNLALEATVASAFKLTGQRCVSSGRILVQNSIFKEFCDKFVAKVKTDVTIGSPFDNPAPYCGPLISKTQLERVEFYNNLVDESVGEVLIQGKRLERKGYYLTPHVYTAKWDLYKNSNKRQVLTEEVFGPHVAIIPFNDLQHAIDIYNDTEYGLAVGIITDDFRKMKILREECNAGMIYLNGGSIAAESHLPFGGIGKSGNGYKSAAGTFRAVTDEVAVTLNYEKGITWCQGMK